MWENKKNGHGKNDRNRLILLAFQLYRPWTPLTGRTMEYSPSLIPSVITKHLDRVRSSCVIMVQNIQQKPWIRC